MRHTRVLIRLLPWFTIGLLFLAPFFWFQPGAIDIGGDSDRLYVYDPWRYLSNASRYVVSPVGTEAVNPNFFFLPFAGFLALVKLVLIQPWLVAGFYSGLKFAGAFGAMYYAIRELLRRSAIQKNQEIISLCALVSSLVYLLATPTTGNWVKALTSQAQIFLNPLMFYFMLKYVLSKSYSTSWKYLCVALVITLIFSPNFALTSAPAFFGFYPLALLYIYALFFVWRIKPDYSKIVVGILLFVGLQAFQLIPQVASVFDRGSFTNSRLFDKAQIIHEGVRYFLGVLPLASLSTNLVLPSVYTLLTPVSAFLTLIIIFGFSRNIKSKEFVVSGLFYLVTLFLLTAKITDVGVALYTKLFYIPGFSMFRNFLGQWVYVFAFFYAIVLGHALLVISVSRKRAIFFLASGIIFFYALINGWPLLTGKTANPVHATSKGMKVAMVMDPQYETFLSYIKDLPWDGRILTLPLTDSFYQVLHGQNDGAYIGPSTIPYLTGKPDFSGYQMVAPFSEQIMKFTKEGSLDALTQLFSLLSIRYVFHNSDSKIYDDTFPQGPYTYMRTAMPQTQKEYKEMLTKLPLVKRFDRGTYQLYEFFEGIVRPKIYVADSIVENNTDDPKFLSNISFRSALMDRELCEFLELTVYCKTQSVLPIELAVEQVAPVQYKIIVRDTSQRPYLLVLQNSFNRNWKVRIGNSELPESQHFVANRYANAWLIRPDDRSSKTEYTLWIELVSQKFFSIGFMITAAFAVVLFVRLGTLVRK